MLRAFPLASLLALSLLGEGCAFTLTDRNLLPQRKAPLPQSSALVSQEPVALPVEGATLRGWLFKVPEARRTIVFFYGNGGSVVSSGGELAYLATALSADIVNLDYRGYGFSDGQATFAALGADAIRAVDWARQRWPDRPLFVAGYSLGTAMAIHAAAARPVAGLALVAPPSSIQDLAQAMKAEGPWYYAFVTVKVEPGILELPQPSEEIAVITAPLLIVHGTEDTQVPLWMGEKLLTRSPARAKELCRVPGADHGTVFLSDPMRECFGRFFLGPARPPAPE